VLHVRHACTCMSVRVTRVDSSHTCMCTMYSNTFARAGFHFKTEIALSPKSTRHMRKSPFQSGHIVKNHTHARDRSMHHPFPPKASELVINFSPNCPPNCHIPSYQNPFMGEARVDKFSSFPEICHALFTVCIRKSSRSTEEYVFTASVFSKHFFFFGKQLVACRLAVGSLLVTSR